VNPPEREALRAAGLIGYPAFPCNGEKRPTCPRGFHAAALPEAGLGTLWVNHPGVLVGVPTGPGSGISVLDVDPRHSGDLWWRANRDRLPPTRQHETRSGGIHLLFRHRSGLRNSEGRIAKGIDVRADGGYVIWWPCHGYSVVDNALADWPDWLEPPPPKPAQKPTRPASRDEAALKGAEAETMRWLRGAAQRLARASEGERNKICFWATCKAAEMLRDGPLPPFVNESWIIDLIADAAARAGLPDREAQRTIASALGRF
jgi:Bifunctional DNA primase/polymerase, N-terminal